MFKKQQDFRSGGGRGGKKFGGGSSWDSRSRGRDSGRPMMHKATCSECGEMCQVPFKPVNGRPIFCSNCFKRDEDGAPKRFEKKDFGRPAFRQESPSAGSYKVEEQLRSMNAKLDAILEMLDSEK